MPSQHVCQPGVTQSIEPEFQATATLMNNKILLMSLFVTLAGLPAITAAEDDSLSTVETGCATETETYCSQVTLGEGRLLACYYAHEDKLSSGCVTALYSTLDLLQAEVNALTHVANECIDDIDKYCATTEPGDGRIAKCLGYHSAELSESCSTAIDEYLASE